MNISEKIILLRKQKGLSQEQLAEQLDVSRQSVYKWETGASIPDLDKLKKMSSYYHVFLENQALQQAGIAHQIANLQLVNSFAHYVGEDINQFKEARIHECVCYVKEL